MWYDGRRPWAAYNHALADSLLASLVSAISAAGHPVVNRGLKEDSYFVVRGGRGFPIFVLGPPRISSTAPATRATQMPAALGETLFLSNAVEAALLARDDIRWAIASGYRQGLLNYFQLIDNGTLAIPDEGFPPDVPNVVTTPAPIVPDGTR